MVDLSLLIQIKNLGIAPESSPFFTLNFYQPSSTTSTSQDTMGRTALASVCFQDSHLYCLDQSALLNHSSPFSIPPCMLGGPVLHLPLGSEYSCRLRDKKGCASYLPTTCSQILTAFSKSAHNSVNSPFIRLSSSYSI